MRMSQHTSSPFLTKGLRSPRLSEAQALAVAREHYGIGGSAVELGSHQDQNFLVADTQGRFVLKVANAAFSADEVDLQNRAMERVAAVLPGAVPTALRARDGRAAVEVDGHVVRLLTFLDGEPLRNFRYVAPAGLRAAGRLAGRVAAALATFDHPAADRVLQWDLRRADEVVAALAPHVGHPARRALLERTAERATAELARRKDTLRVQVIHGDATDWNLLARVNETGRPEPCGLVDFGDVTRSWLAAECAVLATAVSVRAPVRALQEAVEVVRGFHAAMPLLEAEVDALPALMAARAVLSAVGSERQLVLEPDDPYVAESAAYGRTALERVGSIPPALARAAFRAACGLSPTSGRPRALPRGAPVLAAGASAPPLDLSVDTDTLRFGAWRDPAAIACLVPEGDDAVAIGRHGERRIVHDAGPALHEPATVHVGADLFAAAGTDVRAPLAGRIACAGARELLLATADHVVRLAGIEPAVAAGDEVAAGQPIGRVAAPPTSARLPAHVHVQVAIGPLDELRGAATEAPDALPGLVPASLADAWLALCPDPGPMLGLGTTAAPAEDADAALARRRRFVASAHPLYYEPAPPQFERGWRQCLYDAHGRPYLDVINNVAILGHSHPRVEEAAARQFRLLNTNSRFLYDAMGRFAERLAALVPDPLGVVFLVNSGSEANDLAFQIARAITGRETIVSFEGCYHGWTSTTHDLLAGSPRTRAVPRPNTYNGPYRGDTPETAARYAAQVRATIEQLTSEGRPPGAFICEPLLGNSGGVPLPAGYLEQVYRAVRAAGGLCIADEVQVGYGRLGHHFWAFEQQGVVPDVVTIAKATGNGHPIAAVITTREIADAFSADRVVFSSVGGGPVSCEAALAVLDVVAEERLVERARDVGDHLGRLLQPLVDEQPLVGAHHGIGLYRGVELVRDGDPARPAREEALALCERLLELGVVVQPTGAGGNVLKLKPPLCFTREDAEQLVAALRTAFDEGW
jgi:4-aminobutyrate aminotransferase-like enzyme/Ser/Thr protein kinase RdoA (MazF antagonist)